MIAVGCLALVVLPIMGLALGGYLGGLHTGIWCALAGLAIAVLACGVGAVALWKSRRA